MFFSKWIDKQSLRYPYNGLSLNKTEMSYYYKMKTLINLKEILVSKRSLSAKALYGIIPVIWYSGIDKTKKV